MGLFNKLTTRDIQLALSAIVTTPSPKRYSVWIDGDLFPAKDVIRKACANRRITLPRPFNTDEAQNRLLELGYPIWDPKEQTTNGFFTQKDLTSFSKLVERSAYDEKKSVDINIGKYLNRVPWEKTKRWAKLLEDKGWRTKGSKNWNVRNPTSGQKYKDYTWWKIFPPNKHYKFIFFTVGIGANGDLVYKLDCQVDDPFFKKDSNRELFDQLKDKFNISSRVVETKDIQRSNWSLLVQKSHKFFKRHEQSYHKIGKELFETDRRLMRLTWNDSGWQYPTGHKWDRKYQGKTDVAYENQYGFGHEEWLFNSRYRRAGFQYGSIRGVEQMSTKDELIDKIILFTIDPISKDRFLVGELENVEIIENYSSEQKSIVSRFSKHLNEMIAELKSVGADHKPLKKFGFRPNVKFKWEGAEIYDDPILADSLKGRHYNRFQPYKLNVGLKNLIRAETLIENKLIFESGRGATSKGHERKTRGTKRIVKRLHTTISNDLYHYFNQEKKIPKNQLSEEKTRVAGNLVDFVKLEGNKLVLFEIKTNNQALGNIRSAIGQILEYALLDSKAEVKKLVIVGPAELKIFDLTYFKSLQEMIKKPLEYWAYTFEDVALKSKFVIYS